MIRFGVFDFDPATRELRRNGSAVRLQAQPAQVLAILLEARGEVVTREALREAIWGKDTFVDFDRGLNFCISQIRSALGDSASSPIFVRTVPKRGYQFIAPLPDSKPPDVRGNKRLIAAAVIALLAGVATAAFLWRTAQPVTIAVTPFDNETGDPALDLFATALTDSLVAELTADKRYAVIGNAAILRQPRSKRDLTAIGAALNARYVILGQIQDSESGHRVLCHLIRVPEQTHVKVVRLDPMPGSQAEIVRQITAGFAPRITPGP